MVRDMVDVRAMVSDMLSVRTTVRASYVRVRVRVRFAANSFGFGVQSRQS